MKYTIKALFTYVLRAVLHVFYLFPIKKNKILFLSFSGKAYACNPKYIYQYLRSQYGDAFKYIWILPENKDSEELSGCMIVPFKTLAYFYHMMTAAVIVQNQGPGSYLPLRKKQMFINTWHGGGAYKRVGVDADMTPEQTLSTKLSAELTDHMISGCRRFSEVMSHSKMLPIEKMLEIGMPRNDILMSAHPEITEKVKRTYALDPDTHIVIYAPTYRGSEGSAGAEHNDLNITCCLSALSERFGGKWIAFYRVHYFLSSSIPVTEQVIDVSDYPDMQELLCASDVLITDYSSSMWDMSLTGKPCFIYATDVADYQQERDFYTPMEEWPFPTAQNNGELESVIKNFDEQKYADDIKHHHEALGSCETGHASRTVGDFIYQKCFADNKQRN